MFLIFTRTSNYEGNPEDARYQHFLPLKLDLQLGGQIALAWHDLVAGILHYWVSVVSLFPIA